jgi:hypothetical protein
MKLPNMNKRFFTLLGLFTISTSLFAQQTFKYRAALPKVDTSGFYALGLTPDILARSQSNLADIRVFGDGKFTPYIFGSELPKKDQKSFVVFPQVNVDSKSDTATVFIVENKEHLIVNQLYLKLRNTAVDRTVNLSGSDDLNNWYAIKENLALSPASTVNDKGVDEQQLNFPYSTYHYFKIQIDHKNKAPIAILQAGVYKQLIDVPGYAQVPVALFTQKDSAKSSTIVIRFKDNYPINKIHLDIASPKFYKRKINIYQLNGKYFRLLTDTVISSTGAPDLIFSAKTKAIELEIINEDNPPLSIKSATAYELTQKVMAYLEKGKQYQVLFGDSTVDAPNYDLKFFADSLQRNVSQLTPTGVEPNPLYQPKQIKESKAIPEWAIWVAIVAVVLILLLLTLKMTQEVKKRDAED